MTPASALIETARRSAGLTKEELARRAGTSRPTLSAYEHGHKSPRLDTATRILAEAGFHLGLEPDVTYREIRTRHHRVASVPDRLRRLSASQAVATVELPTHVDWSSANRMVDLADRRQRARTYEVVLREGTPADLDRFIDGALLVDLWDDLVLPTDIRAAWQPLIEETRAS